MNALEQERPTASFEVDDVRLMGRIAGRDPLALAELYDRHHLRAHRTAMNLYADRRQAEAAVEQTFLNLWRSPRYDPRRGTPGTWITVLMCESAAEGTRCDHGGVPRLADLSEAQHEIFQLACKGHLTVDEIASHLDLPLAVVKRALSATLHRAGRGQVSEPRESVAGSLRSPTANSALTSR